MGLVHVHIIGLVMVHQFYYNVTSDHQPKISNHLNYLVFDWLPASTILQLMYENLKNL